MANSNKNTTVHKVGRMPIYDADDRLVLVIDSQKRTVVTPKGTMFEFELDDYIQLVDGLVWNPSMMKQANPILLTSCAECRHPRVSLFSRTRPNHGLLSVRNARVCAQCGVVTCPRHRSMHGKHWRCLKCAGRFRIQRALRPLFFERREEQL